MTTRPTSGDRVSSWAGFADLFDWLPVLGGPASLFAQLPPAIDLLLDS